MLVRDKNLSPLAGVPVAVNARIEQADSAATNGVALQKDWVAQTNNPVDRFVTGRLIERVVPTGLVDCTPVSVQSVAVRYRERLCLAAGEGIQMPGVPPMPE